MTLTRFVQRHFSEARNGVDVSMALLRHYFECSRDELRRKRYRRAWSDFRFALTWFWYSWCDGRGDTAGRWEWDEAKARKR